MKKIFIIGGGIAALEAAKSARSTQRDALIVDRKSTRLNSSHPK